MVRVARARTTPPVIPAGLVRRPALLAALERCESDALTLLCAPPGYGKSVLLADWARWSGAPTAWVSLEEDDGDPRRFWSAVLAAFLACPEVPESSRLRGLVVSRTTVEVDFVTDLLEALEGLPERIRLVLDDVHHLNRADALRGIQLLVRMRPRRLRLVLASRADPALPLARLRLEERLCELRAEQLRFTEAESRSLLARHGIVLDHGQIALLHARTDGWPAGLRLAALQLRGHPDPDKFLAHFSGDDRPVADYLVGEVLSQIPADERDVLRSTSICDTVPAGLAAELSGRGDAANLLDRLEHDTGMVVRAGQGSGEYRIQQLLRSYLVADLGRAGPARVAELHARTARWWSREGRPLEALQHAALAADGALLTELVHRWAAELAARGEHDALLTAVAAARERADGEDPWLPVATAQVHLARGDRSRVAAELRAAGEAPERDPGLAAFRVATERLAWLGGSTIEDEDEPGADDPALAAIAHAGRAAALLATGALAEAGAAATTALASARDQGLGLLEVQCLCVLGATAWAAGDYRAAAAAAAAGASAGVEHGWEHSAWSAAAHAVAAHAALMRARPAKALRAAAAGLQAGPDELDPVVRFALRVARGAAQSDSGRRAAGLLESQEARAELRGAALPGPLAVTAAVLEHHAALQSGHAAAASAALSWLSAQDAGRPEQLLLRAATEIAGGRHRDARRLVAPLISGDTASALPCTVVDAALLDATAALAEGDRPAARSAMALALTCAEALDALRPFALASTEVRVLLVDQLGGVDEPGAFGMRALAARRRESLGRGPTVLSSRERDVLQMLPSLRNLDEIADDLGVSVNTIKSHVRAIYSKLGVSSRRTAVLAAHEQGLLGC